MLRRTFIGAAALAIAGAIDAASFATITLSPVFTDHAVLQRDLPLPVWGRAPVGAEVTVTFAGQTKKATAGADGRFAVSLDPLVASATPAELVVATKDERLVVHDVLVGEVWLCGGQSNMEWPMAACNDFDAAKAEASTGGRRTIRAIKFPHTIAEQPLGTNDAAWRVTDGDSVGSITGVGYHFGCAIADALKVPVGLLDINWGGTPIEQWMKDGGMNRGMLMPAAPYATRGAIWYQGESNAGASDKYAGQLRDMIGWWREAYRRPDMPFGIVQLASFMDPSDNPVEGGWSGLREAQAQVAASVPHCGLAVTLDIGDAKDIHPRDKKTVGERLAAWALATEYGRPIAVWSSPVVESVERAQMTTGEKGIRVRFRHGEGLKARTGEAIDGFAIAGPDGTFVWAKAMVDAKSSDPADHASVVVWAEGIADPVEVAYAWQNNPVKANLVNGAGWPAGPFKGKVK